MDTQNVSAQLYFKQLPADKSAGSYNCENTGPYLSTCVNNVETDTQIENAFQDQLNLSEIYKSPQIFNKVKEQFMNETMEAQNTPVNGPSFPQNKKPPPPSVPINIPVGPEDFLRKFIKEGFGSTSSILIIVALVALVALVFFAMYYK